MNFKRFHESKNLFDEVYEQGGISLTGDTATAANRVRTFIAVEPNQTYTFKSNKYIRIIYGYYNDDKIDIVFNDTSMTSSHHTFTVPSTMNRIGIALGNYANIGNLTPSDVENSMFNTGSTSLPYEPYSPDIWHDSHYIRVNGEWQAVASAHERSGSQWD